MVDQRAKRAWIVTNWSGLLVRRQVRADVATTLVIISDAPIPCGLAEIISYVVGTGRTTLENYPSRFLVHAVVISLQGEDQFHSCMAMSATLNRPKGSLRLTYVNSAHSR